MKRENEVLTKDDLIRKFQLIAHPEGGAFAESYRASSDVTADGFPAKRSASTAIYFLLLQGEISAFHRIRSDEVWHFYLGDPLRIVEIDENASVQETILGRDVLGEQKLQYTVKAGRWFASTPAAGSSWSFVGCTVAPGFDFADFELAERDKLIREFPQYEALIRTLTQPSH